MKTIKTLKSNSKIEKSIFVSLLSLILLFAVSNSTAQTTQNFTATTTWTCPVGVSSVTVSCWGAGGGGLTTTTAARGTGGGGGAFAQSSVAVVPGTSYTITVGTGGGAGAAGGDSWFSSISTVLAKGGGGATSGSSAGAGGAAASCVGSIKASGFIQPFGLWGPFCYNFLPFGTLSKLLVVITETMLT